MFVPSLYTNIFKMPFFQMNPVFGEKTKNLKTIFERLAVDNYLTADQLRKCLHNLNIYPAESQVIEFVNDACRVVNRQNKEQITFGEFCFIVSSLQDEYKKRKSSNLSKEKCEQCGLDLIFLGGSCNPTTWRTDTVIPFLKHHKLTYYNPQREDWSEKLVQEETEAKERAEVLFFVIDNVTRSTASMVESANLAAKGKPLVLIIKRFNCPDDEVAGEKLSQIEYQDLCRSHSYLTHLVEQRGIPVFNDIEIALSCLRKVLHENISLEELTLMDGAMPVKFPSIRISSKFRHIKQVFEKHRKNSNNTLNRDEVNDAFKEICQGDMPKWIWIECTEKQFTMEEFYCLITEFKDCRSNMMLSILNGFTKIPYMIYDWLTGRRQDYFDRGISEQEYQVFLGGTCAKSLWREEIAIPLLDAAGVTYYNPNNPEWTTKYISREAAVKNNCKVLLYVITSQSRGITSMLESAYYAGMGNKVIFCIQNISSGNIAGETLSENAIKDYNRARTYLKEITLNCKHFMFIEDAVNETIRTVKFL